MRTTNQRSWRSMFAMACAVSVCALAFPAPAARIQDRTQLSVLDIPALRGKSLAITAHAPPPYFGADRLWSGFVPIAASARSDDEAFRSNNALTDPGVVARDVLAADLRDVYGLQPRTVDTAPTDETRPKPIAALHPDADFVLDVRTLSWQHFKSKGRAYPRLLLEFQLINVATRHTEAWMRCDTLMDRLMPPDDTAPLLSAAESDGGTWLRHAFSVFAARCARKFATQRLLMSPEKQAATQALAEMDPYVVPVAAQGAGSTSSRSGTTP